MSLDRTDHPKDYYVQLYLDKSNAKNKITRDNTSFYKESNILKGKRKREQIKENIDDKDENDSNYEEEEYEYEEEYEEGDDDKDSDYIYEENEEINNNNNNRRERKNYSVNKRIKRVEQKNIIA
jgi:hypothetical protein